MTPEVDLLNLDNQEAAKLSGKENLVNSPTLVEDIRNNNRVLRLMFGDPDSDNKPNNFEVADHKKSPAQRNFENSVTTMYGS